MIKPGQIERANGRAALSGLPIVLVRHQGGDDYAFKKVDRLNAQLAKDNLGAVSFDLSGFAMFHWDGPELICPRVAQLIDWFFTTARKMAGIYLPGAESIVVATELKT